MKLSLLGIATLFFLGISTAQAQNAAVVVVNGTKIMQKEVDVIAKNAVLRGAKDSPELRQAIVNDLILREAILQDVKKNSIDKKGDNPEKIKLAQQQVLQELWFEEYLKAHPISEVDVRSDYDRQFNLTKDGKNTNEYKISQIIVSNESEAKDIISQINSGASFEKLAAEKSLEKTSGSQGGAFPNWVLPDMVVQPLGDSLVAIPKGKIDPKPIRTNMGWHVVRVDDVRKFKMPSFEESKNNVYQGLVNRKKQEAVDVLMKKTTITKPN